MGNQDTSKGLIFLLAILLGTSLACTSANAQWIGYASKDVPRNADGTVNMKAPVPRMANGKPDLSGIWIADRTPEGEETPSSVDNI